MTTTIFDLYLSTENVDLDIEFEIATIIESMGSIELSKIEHSYARYGSYKYRLQPLISHRKFALMGGKL